MYRFERASATQQSLPKKLTCKNWNKSLPQIRELAWKKDKSKS